MTKDEIVRAGMSQIADQIKAEHDGTDFEKAMEYLRVALAFAHAAYEEGDIN